MSIASELAQREKEVWEAARRAAPPQEYEPLYKKWEEVYRVYLLELANAVLNDAATIETLSLAGTVSEIRQALSEMTKRLVKEIAPALQKRVFDEVQAERLSH